MTAAQQKFLRRPHEQQMLLQAFSGSQLTVQRRSQRKVFSSFVLTACTLIAAGALIIGTSKLVAEPGEMPATGMSAPASGQDTSAAIDLTGTWLFSWTAKNEEQRQLAMKLTQNGSQLSGSVDWGRQSPAQVKGALNGNQVSLNMKFRRKVSLTGTVNGDKMSGTGSKGVPWSATRQ
jgi:hypothetical protein